MLKKTVSYTDYNGNDQIETLYFNLTKTELIEMEMEVDEGLSKRLQDIVQQQRGGEMMKFIKSFISNAYGQRSDDGKRFAKTPAMAEEFLQTAAYDALFSELILDPEKALEFILGVMPASMTGTPEVKQIVETEKAKLQTAPPVLETVELPEEPQSKPIDQMTAEELREHIKSRGM